MKIRSLQIVITCLLLLTQSSLAAVDLANGLDLNAPDDEAPNMPETVLITPDRGAFTDLHDEPGPSSKLVYRARDGEVLRATTAVSGGYRVVDGYQGNRLVAPLFVADSEIKIADAKTAKGAAKMNMGKKVQTLAAHFDLEENQIATLFAEPGLGLNDCAARRTRCTDASASQDIEITDSRMMKVNDASGTLTWQNFYLIKYGRIRHAPFNLPKPHRRR
jgi:hypothetical protein